MKYIIGLIAGVVLASFMYEGEKDMIAESLTPKSGEEKIGYSFYENLYNTSVTVIENVYDSDVELISGDSVSNFNVQLGSFSKLESAEAFRAEVILEGYMPSDISVQSFSDYHRVVIGPFAHRVEANLAMDWAESRQFSSLLISSN
jgi:hypothetical protein